jgi:hypothetical protein
LRVAENLGVSSGGITLVGRLVMTNEFFVNDFLRDHLARIAPATAATPAP